MVHEYLECTHHNKNKDEPTSHAQSERVTPAMPAVETGSQCSISPQCHHCDHYAYYDCSCNRHYCLPDSYKRWAFYVEIYSDEWYDDSTHFPIMSKQGWSMTNCWINHHDCHCNHHCLYHHCHDWLIFSTSKMKTFCIYFYQGNITFKKHNKFSFIHNQFSRIFVDKLIFCNSFR